MNSLRKRILTMNWPMTFQVFISNIDKDLLKTPNQARTLEFNKNINPSS